MAAAVVIASLKIDSHLLKGRLLLISTLPRSYRSASSVNNTSISSRIYCTFRTPLARRMQDGLAAAILGVLDSILSLLKAVGSFRKPLERFGRIWATPEPQIHLPTAA